MVNKKITPENLDDYFTDFIEEDKELLEELEEATFVGASHDGLIMAVEEQIFMLDYVHDTYYRLRENHSDTEALELITSVLEKMDNVLDEEKYKKALNELK